MKGKKHISKVTTAVAYALCVVIVAGLVVGNYYALKYQNLISVHFNQSNQKIVSAAGESSEYYTSDFDSEEERIAHLQEIGTKIEEEGIVLLKDENDALPLASGARISIFGQDSVDPVYGGGGAGSVDAAKAVDLEMAFEKSGFALNQTLWDFYESGEGSTYRKTTPDVYGKGSFAVNEVPEDVYTDEVKASFAEYSDAAVVVIGRSGGESSDLSSAPLESGYAYLQLDDDERAMLQMACDSFDQVVVLLNTQNAMELGFLEEYDVDACLWIGALGETGAYAVADVLAGEVNPSGALVDTYAYDSLSAPSMENFGKYSIANSEVDRGNAYMVYGEGIYVGYHYYETRYEDVVLGNEDKANYDYTAAVQYPLGYGLSYTEFEWSDFTVSETEDTYEITTTVTNTGDLAGKEIVQIYMQSPYTDYDKENGIEKASVELAGFEKTAEIEAGKSETVTVSVDKEEMKTYDAKGYSTYIVDAGDYYFAAGENAHDALNNILAAKGKTTADGMDYDGNAEFTTKVTVDKLDAETYAVSQDTGNAITNQFEEADMSYYDPEFQYLSRSSWTETWPATYADGVLTASDEMLADLEISFSEAENAEGPVTDTISEEIGELNAATLIGEEYQNELWNVLTEQMSAEELDQLVRVGGYATNSVESIQLPATIDKDGPAGISGTLVGGESGTSYPPEVVIASTWNLDLAEEFGACIGEDSMALGVAVWYAPACNIHRSPYSGRNFEYYSEDGFLSGKMAAGTVAGAQSKGTVVTVKHFALNDQECNRVGGAMFANEQSVRELYLQPFEIAVREGDALGMMASMNRIGCRWTGGHYGLMTSTLRDEWGFEGMVVTDQASYSVFAYEDLREGLEAGTDLWLNTDATLWTLTDEDMTPTVLTNMQRAAKNVVYAVANSNAMNGLSAGSKVVAVMPLWQKALITVDAVAGILVATAVISLTRRLMKQKKRNIEIVTEE
ncbi:glycoside hydrolase family 3 protein [Anaerobium acetethylicum]|uniref:Beta-glucosidase n=1 Tax=Anaerobium acetethylicum TaxID=1619234 RepID=A0A1D3TWP1_9FIRM|nr:glycoside hydrolase family 3 protein [Anaerobium acetethylicum]SCP98672.1 beta-glucosidase [Anaerobium acetethylicum]